MKAPSVRRSPLLAASAAVFVAAAAHAAEPRPWLCRDKLVVSSDRPAAYEVTARARRRWRLFFMQFTPDGPHDGFSIVQGCDFRAGGGDASGRLAPGRYYAAALYRNPDGRWICSGDAWERAESRPGSARVLCFGERAPGCRVRLAVKPDSARGAP